MQTLLKNWRDFPGGPVVKNLPSNVEDLGSIPSRGTKDPHAPGDWAHTPQLLSSCITMKIPHATAKTQHSNKQTNEEKLWRFHKKLKTGPVWSNNSTPGHISRGKHGYLHPVITETLFTILKTWKQFKCQLTYEWIKKMWYIYTMEYCAVLYLVAQLYPTLCDLMDCSLPVSSIEEEEVLNPGLLYCRQILYWLSYQGWKASY